MESNKMDSVELTRFTKLQRTNIEDILGSLRAMSENYGSREISLAITKLEEGKMWLGKHLGNIPGNVDLNKERDE